MNKATIRFHCSIIFVTLMVGLLWVGCTKDDDAEQIRTLIKTAAELAESHDSRGLLNLGTKDLHAMPGSIDQRGIRGVLWQAFKHYGEFAVLYPRAGVDVYADQGRALASFPFLIVKTDQSFPGLEGLRQNPEAWIDAIGEAADLYSMDLELIRQGGDWRVKVVTVKPFSALK